MKIVIITLAICVIATPAMAGLWELDKDTALALNDAYLVDPTYGNTDTIGSLTIYNGYNYLYGPMSGAVGFEGGKMYDISNDGFVAAIIFGDVSGLGLTGSGYGGITSYFQNDNDNYYSVELFYNIGGSLDGNGYITGGNTYSSGYTQLAGGGGSKYLDAGPGGTGLDISTIDYIGFKVRAWVKGTPSTDYPSQGDSFHISVVPTPAAIILGMLGLSVAGIKLRKYA